MYGYGCFISANGKPPSGVAIDADAQSFFTATGITDATQKNAVNQLVLDLKSNSLWTKMKAIYPIVGGNATAHSYNLKDTAQYQLSFSSGWTHSSDGMQGNGSNSFASLGYYASEFMSTGKGHMSIYSRSTGSAFETMYEMGAYGGSGYTTLALRLSNTFYGNIKSTTNNSIANTNAQGLFTASRLDSTNVLLSKNNTITTTTGSEATTSGNIVIGAVGTVGSQQFYSNKQFSLASIGDSLTSTDISNYYTIVQAFQTTLSRQV